MTMVLRRTSSRRGSCRERTSPRSLCWALPLAALLAAGCSKHEPAASANAATNAAEANPSAAAPATPPTRGPGPVLPPAKATVIADTGNMDATLAQLSQELRKFVIRTRSVPKDFEDFIAKSRVQAPPPPAGKKYVIKDQAVALVKR